VGVGVGVGVWVCGCVGGVGWGGVDGGEWVGTTTGSQVCLVHLHPSPVLSTPTRALTMLHCCL
jgi:hypothetical protein